MVAFLASLFDVWCKNSCHENLKKKCFNSGLRIALNPDTIQVLDINLFLARRLCPVDEDNSCPSIKIA